jgi:hypothetical protein
VKANTKITSADLALAGAVRTLAWPGGSVLAADLAAHLARPVAEVLRTAENAQRHGVAYWYTYAGERRVGLSNEGWELR